MYVYIAFGQLVQFPKAIWSMSLISKTFKFRKEMKDLKPFVRNATKKIHKERKKEREKNELHCQTLE